MIRFFPDEIKLVFPEIFNMEIEENKAFMQSETLDVLIKSMNEKLQDKNFEAFKNM